EEVGAKAQWQMEEAQIRRTRGTSGYDHEAMRRGLHRAGKVAEGNGVAPVKGPVYRLEQIIDRYAGAAKPRAHVNGRFAECDVDALHQFVDRNGAIVVAVADADVSGWRCTVACRSAADPGQEHGAEHRRAPYRSANVEACA